jgi:hypothetical protein
MTGWTPTVSSLFRNIEVLVAARAPRSYALRLGLSWGFGLPADGRTAFTEFSLPLQAADPLPDLWRRRGGVDVTAHADPTGAGMDDHQRATGNPVIAVVDSFHLPYRPAHGRVHSSRTVVVRPADAGHVLVDDCWQPSYRGLLHRRHLADARRSAAPADPELEPVFSGVRVPAEWFDVRVRPFAVEDPAGWATGMLATLAGEMTPPGSVPGAVFGLAAIRDLADALDGRIERRTLALVLRAELSRRRYLCSTLRNLLILAGRPDTVDDVDRYQQGLRHLQAARDVMIKTLRSRRPEYETYLRARCHDALAGEERLLAALAAAGLPCAPARPEPAEAEAVGGP